MTHSRGLLAIACLSILGLSAVVYVAFVRHEDSGARDVPAARAGTPEAGELSALRQHVARLEREVRSQGQAHAVVNAAGAEVSATSGDPPATDAESIAERERGRAEFMAELGTAFRNEAIDARWSTATTAAVEAALTADEELRRRVRNVECRSQTCRVEIADDGSRMIGVALQTFVMQVGAELPAMHSERVAGAGGSSTVLYMGRLPGVQVSVQ